MRLTKSGQRTSSEGGDRRGASQERKLWGRGNGCQITDNRVIPRHRSPQEKSGRCLEVTWQSDPAPSGSRASTMSPDFPETLLLAHLCLDLEHSPVSLTALAGCPPNTITVLECLPPQDLDVIPLPTQPHTHLTCPPHQQKSQLPCGRNPLPLITICLLLSFSFHPLSASRFSPTCLASRSSPRTCSWGFLPLTPHLLC